jgi:hypothetical protein
MTGPIIPIADIVIAGRTAAEAGKSVQACPYPGDWPAAYRWRVAFYAREKELRAEVEP